MTIRQGFTRALLALAAAWVLTACGGGGGGGGSGGGGGGTDPSTAPGLTLSRTSVALQAMMTLPAAPQDIVVTVTGSEVAGVVAGYAPGVTPPPWLSVSAIGSGTTFTLRLTPNIGSLAAGNYSTSLRVVAGRADQTVIAYRDVAITLRLDPALVPSIASLSGNGISGSQAQGGNALNITTPGAWTVSATAPWITFSAASGTGNGVVNVGFNPAGLAAGTYTGEIVINGPNGVTQRIQVSFTVALPTLSAGASSITLGGANGRDLRPVNVPLQLSTASVAHAWSVSGIPAWATITPTSGTVSSASAPLVLTPNRSAAGVGSQSATLTFTATVNGQAITTSVGVTLNLDAHKLVASETGVALMSSPTTQRLQRAVRIRSNLIVSTPWTASADVPWLSVTPSGTTGTDLVISAAPATLTADRLHRATVTLVSSDPTVIAPERIEVGLWKTSTAPAPRQLTVPAIGGAMRMVADPIRPHIYVHNGGSELVGFNVYTGQEIGRISNVAGEAAGMTIVADGSRLFVGDRTTTRIVPIELASFTPAAPWPVPVPPTAVPSYRPVDHIAAIRANGTSLLVIGGGGTVFNAATGSRLDTSSLPVSTVDAQGEVAAARDTAAVFVDRTTDLRRLDFDVAVPYGNNRYARDVTATAGVSVQNSGTLFTAFSPNLAVAADLSRLYLRNNALDGATLAPMGQVFPVSGAGTIHLPSQIDVATGGSVYFFTNVYLPPDPFNPPPPQLWRLRPGSISTGTSTDVVLTSVPFGLMRSSSDGVMMAFVTMATAPSASQFSAVPLPP
jgi:hypothetical protein